MLPIDTVDMNPEIEFAEIVRCRNCKFFRLNFPVDGYGWCDNSDAGVGECNEVFYCAYGEQDGT